MDISFDNIEYYTNSKVVLGCIYNQTQRFYMYVHNRIQRILQSTHPNQWKYVASELNPADCSVTTAQLSTTTWLEGQAFLLKPLVQVPSPNYDLIDPTADTLPRYAPWRQQT